ncbi:hypothetical protein ACIRPK_09255 [Kitasatospora sp. NPDC101801]|uniref:hypothetical protein n=1 Tax=Kitasatospora sp. NPDC101801 TaxID=3364103 RepID=UPI003811FDD0
MLGRSEPWTAADRQRSAAAVHSLTTGQPTARYESTGTVGATLLAGGRLLWWSARPDRTRAAPSAPAPRTPRA